MSVQVHRDMQLRSHCFVPIKPAHLRSYTGSDTALNADSVPNARNPSPQTDSSTTILCAMVGGMSDEVPWSDLTEAVQEVSVHRTIRMPILKLFEDILDLSS